MIITILAIVLGLVMAVGGVVPNVANGMLENRLKEALNQPEYLRVQVHPAAPSASLLSGTVAYTEIDARRFVVSDLPVESLSLRVDRLDVDTSGESPSLRQPSQGSVRVRLTEAGLNQFLRSDTFRRLLDELRQRQELAAQLDADLTDLNLDLQPDKVALQGQAATMGGFFTIPFELSGRMRLGSERTLLVQDVQATTLGRPLSGDMIQAVLNQLNPVLDLTRLSNDDMQLFFREVQVGEGYLELIGEAQLKKLPQ